MKLTTITTRTTHTMTVGELLAVLVPLGIEINEKSRLLLSVYGTVVVLDAKRPKDLVHLTITNEEIQ